MTDDLQPTCPHAPAEVPTPPTDEQIRRWLGGPRPPHAVRAVAAVAPRGVPGLREGLRHLMGRVFGPPSTGPDQPESSHGAAPGGGATGADSTATAAAHAPASDPGLCGPGSASWKLLGEPDALVGGIRALLLQSLHPAAMAGVADHSAFRADALGRLRSTASYVTISTFGSSRRAIAAAERVRRTHRRVVGTTPAGRPYDADDPHLLAWVSVALTSSFLAADRLFSPYPLDGRAADAFVDEQSRIAALLDPRVDLGELARRPEPGRALRSGEIELPMLAAHLPTTQAQLLTTLEAFEPELQAGEQARQAIAFLRFPPLSAPLRAAYLWLFVGAAGSMAAEDRRRLGLPVGRGAGVAGVAATAGAVALLRGISGRSSAAGAAHARIRTAT